MKVLKITSLLVLLIAGLDIETLAQKIKGVYFGNLISEKNALIISSSGDELTGLCYLNKTDKLNFTGSYIDKQLKGTIVLQDGSQVSLEGYLENGYLKLTYVMNNQQMSTSLVKFSSSNRSDPEDIYSERHDPSLVAKWDFVRQVEKDGSISSAAKLILEFEPNGRKTSQVISVPPEFLNKLPAGANPYHKAEFSWHTDGGKLSSAVRTTKGEMGGGTLPYSVNNDTLTIYGTKSSTVYVRHQ